MGYGSDNESSRAALLTDRELVLEAQRGEKRAFVQIVARYQALVCGIAFGILNDFAGSEDAGQEAFLTAWRKIRDLREPDRLRSWLAQIARNAALGRLRRERGTEPLDREAFDLPDSHPRPDEAAVSGEEANLVRQALEKLPENYRVPLALYYRETQSVREIAEALAISEDAVKQRLMRGRDLLRERMAGVVETVLKRTSPNGIFTMSIAVAIGALAAPAVMAAGAFAAASAASAATASSTSSSLFTAMTASKTGLAVAAAVTLACIPLGYEVSGRLERTGRTKPAAPDSAAMHPQAAVHNFEGSALFAEWRALHQKHGTNAQALPAIFAEIREIKDPLRQSAFKAALIAEWVQIDPASGIWFFSEKTLVLEREQFFEEWLAVHPREAVDALPHEGEWADTIRYALSEIARRVPDRVADLVSWLPAEGFNDSHVSDAFKILAESDLAKARETADQVTGPNRQFALAGVAAFWAKTDFDAALSWTKTLPNIDHDELVRAALTGLAVSDPTAALDQVNIVPAGGRSGFGTSTTGARVLEAAAKSDFDGAVSWLAEHPGKLSREDVLGISDEVTDRLNADPSGFLTVHANEGSLSPLVPAIEQALLNNASGNRTAVWEWLKTQPPSGDVRALRSAILNGAGWQDPDLAFRLASDLPANAQGDQEIVTVARSLLNSGNELPRFDKLYAAAPERLRGPLVKEAFDALSGNLDDPQAWIQRLSLLPKADRIGGIGSIAAGWATQSPEEAAQWVTSLPDGETQNHAIYQLTSAWVAKDQRGAIGWIESLAPGLPRDEATESLVEKIAGSAPAEAWQWTLSIGDELQRSRAVSQTVQSVAERDPALAQQWLEAAQISPELKTRLASIVDLLSRK